MRNYSVMLCQTYNVIFRSFPVMVIFIFNFLFRNTIHGNNEFSAKICPCFEKS